MIRAPRFSPDGTARNSSRSGSSPSGPPSQGDRGFVEAHLGRQRGQLAGRDVGQVRDEQVHPGVSVRGAADVSGRPGQPVGERCLRPRDAVGHAVRDRVPAGHGQRGGRDVDRRYRRSRKLVRERNREAAGASPDVGDRKRGPSTVAEQLQRGFDDQLGLGARRQHCRPDREGQAPELAVPGDDRDRFAPLPAGGEQRIASLEARRRRVAASGEIRGAVPPQHVTGQHLRVGGGLVRGHPGAQEAIPRPRQPVGERGGVGEQGGVGGRGVGGRRGLTEGRGARE